MGKTKMSHFQKIISYIKKNRDLSLFIAIAFFSLCGFALSGNSSPTPIQEKRTESFDTFIPDGFSLLPIEVANYETLDSLLGPFGVVDLYTAPQTPDEKSRRIAYRVKILRAPRNPSHFAVLVPFEMVKNILRFPGPFMVSVQNPKSSGTGLEKEPSKTASRILYNLGE
jgi:hypothetical protein